jgi:ketosteroid isomerase-like protein
VAVDPETRVREAYAAFNAGARVPTLEWWHADGEYVASRDDPDAATHSGIAAVQAQYARWVEAYPDLRVEPLEVRANGDVVFVWVRFAGHGAESNIPIDMELAHVVTVKDGKIKQIAEFNDRDEGLAAAGLAATAG